MKNKRKQITSGIMYATILILVYFAMFFLCTQWDFRDKKMENIIINGAMFVIVGIIFYFAIGKGFKNVDKIKTCLTNSMEQIGDDYKKNRKYLWNLYKEKDIFQFEQKDLESAYESYKSEMRYLESHDSDSSTCDIENYINRELIDDVAKKSLLNLIPGVMTGMGILGTFIGLSFGLQSFNTGTSEEIAESIAPLMDGIKVAFHTSIYGMVFSLVFNFLFKKIFEEAYQVIDEFVDLYHKAVVPEADSDNISKIIIGQQKQSEAIVNPIVFALTDLNDNILEMCSVQQKQLQQLEQMPQVVEDSIGRKLSEQIIPQFNAMNKNFEMFAQMVGDMQLKGMENLIDKFTTQTSAVMVDSYKNLKNTIADTCDLQEKNGRQMVDILSKVQGMTMNIQQINNLSQQTVKDMSGYVEKVESLQDIITESCGSFSRQLDKNAEYERRMHEYIDTVEEYQKQCGQATEQYASELKRQVEIFKEIEEKVLEDVRKEMELLINNASECNKKVSEAAIKQMNSINGFSDSMTVDMTNAAQTLETVASGFNEQLRKNLNDSNVELQKNLNDSIAILQTKLNDSNEKLQNNLDESNKVLQTNLKSSNTELQKNLDDSIDKLHNELDISNEKLQNNLTNSNVDLGSKLKDSLSLLDKNIGEGANDFATKLSDKMEAFNKISEEANERLQNEIKNALEKFDIGLSQNMNNVIDKFGATADQIGNSATGLDEISQKFHDQMSTEVEKIFEDFADKLEKNLSDMADRVGGTTKQLGEAATELGTVTKEFNGKLNKSLTDVFVSFDRELADICSRLSGTIMEVENTTGRVPGVISKAYEEMGKMVKEMETQMLNLINQIAVVEEQIQRMQNN